MEATCSKAPTPNFPAISGRILRVLRGKGIRNFTRAVLSCLAGTLALFAIMSVFRHLPLANEATVGLVFLLSILVAAAISGYATSLSMAITATLLYDYFFIPPVDTWNVADYRDWVTLGVFLSTAVVGSTLSHVARRETQRARLQRKEAEQLYDLSHRLSSSGSAFAICEAIPHEIVEVFAARAAAILIAEEQVVFRSRDTLHHFDLVKMRACMSDQGPAIDPVNETSYVALRLGGGVIGSVAIVGPSISSTTLDSLGALMAMAIERARKVEQIAEMEALREREALKTFLVDAITHEFRTPLTAVKASATLMRDNLDSGLEQRKECVAIIVEGCDRLNHLIEEISQMSLLESRDVRLDLARHSIGDLVSTAMAESRDVLNSRLLERRIANEESAIKIDLFWANKILKHLLANAALYSTPGTPITIRTEVKDSLAYFHVEDYGPGIEAEEVNRIFEKFYRGKKHRCCVHGTGMGLPIARAITEAHGGTMTVTSSVGKGSVFSFSLPLDRPAIFERLLKACNTPRVTEDNAQNAVTGGQLQPALSASVIREDCRHIG